MKFHHLLMLLLMPVLLCAQQDQLHFSRVSGLSQNTGYSILKDRQGFLWVATANGLNRFDGVEMKVYKPSFGFKAGDMKGRIIRSSLLEDEKERIWFSTDAAVTSLDKRTQKFKQYPLSVIVNGQKSKPWELFANPIMIRKDTVWLASSTEGIFALNSSTGECTNYPVTLFNKEGNRVPLMYRAAFNGKNKLWFASRDGLLNFDIETHQWKHFLKERSFFVAALRADTLYLGNQESIVWFDTKTFTHGFARKSKPPASIKEGLVREIYIDHKGNCWAGDQEGNIYKQEIGLPFEWRGNINGNGVSWTNYPVYHIDTDSTGNLWVTADVLGLLKADIETPLFNIYPSKYGEPVPNSKFFVHSVYEDGEGKIWLGTFRNGVIIVDPKSGHSERVYFPHKSSGPYAESVPLVKGDAQGNIWMSYAGYLYVREKGTKNLKAIRIPEPPNALQAPQMWALIDYDKGWLIGTNIGLYRIEKKNGDYAVRHIPYLGQSKIISLWIAPDKQLWVVPEGSGVVVLRSMHDSITSNRLFPLESVKALHYENGSHLIWIGTTNGLIAYNMTNGNYNLYNERNGLQSSYVYGVLQSKNEIWISTNGGLSRGLISDSPDSTFPTITFSNFTQAHGLPADEFNTGAYFHGKSGNLLFGSINGVTWFKPADIRAAVSSPQMQMLSFAINDQSADSLLKNGKLDLGYLENSLLFKFRGIDFRNPAEIKYQYQLVGWDKDWVFSNHINEVRYNRLPHGDYLFKVRAQNSAGTWSPETILIPITIHPPFWKTWWFYGLIYIVIVLVIIQITRYYSQQKLKKKVAELERQKEIDKERQRISREMHDDIGAGLTQITLMSESAKVRNGGQELDDIAITSRQLVNNMSEIIWSLQPDSKSVEQLMSYLREKLHKQLEYSGIDYSIELPEDGNAIFLSNEQRRNLLLVTKEVVNNAIRHSKAKSLSVKSFINKDSLYFEITDNGNGFVLGEKRGNGLKNIEHRIRELNGTLHIDSDPGKGTYIKYIIPFKDSTT